MPDPYTSHSTGKLKLKGVKDSKVSKSKKKSSSASSGAKAPKPSSGDTPADPDPDPDTQKDNSVVLRHLAEEDAQITHDSPTNSGHQQRPSRPNVPNTSTTRGGSTAAAVDADAEQGDDGDARKTEAERRWEEQRRRRLEERLRREGVKTHKERVEELNRYLSGLSEHHDMPKIGPG